MVCCSNVVISTHFLKHWFGRITGTCNINSSLYIFYNIACATRIEEWICSWYFVVCVPNSQVLVKYQLGRRVESNCWSELFLMAMDFDVLLKSLAGHLGHGWGLMWVWHPRLKPNLGAKLSNSSLIEEKSWGLRWVWLPKLKPHLGKKFLNSSLMGEINRLEP